MDAALTADQIIADLNLQPHPEGGFYRQTWVDEAQGSDRPTDRPTNRPTGTCIYFLLKAGQSSHWHRVDAVEIWHFYAGTPLTLKLSATDAGPARHITLGPDLAAGHQPQAIVPKDHWQAASAGDGWALVGCTVSPGFQFEGFTLAAPEFDIPAEC